jgi:DNA repair exonuclease SbcCD ATPase subunit
MAEIFRYTNERKCNNDSRNELESLLRSLFKAIPIHCTSLNSDLPQAPLEVECPVCKSSLSKDQYKKALQELLKTLLRNYRQKHREEKQEYRTKIAELKVLQKKEVRSVMTQEKNRRKALQVKLNEQTRKERKKHRQELQQIKRKYQVQLEQVRTSYADQNTQLQDQIRTEYNNNLSQLMKRYEDLAINSAQRLEMIQSSIGELEKLLKAAQVVQTSAVDERVEQQESVGGYRTEDPEEKRLEIERLKKIREISEMIREMAQKQHKS